MGGIAKNKKFFKIILGHLYLSCHTLNKKIRLKNSIRFVFYLSNNLDDFFQKKGLEICLILYESLFFLFRQKSRQK